MMHRGFWLRVAALALMGCRASPQSDASPDSSAPSAGSAAASAKPSRSPALKVGWDPATGKGDVVHRLAGGDRMRTCFHCGYAGYTGGLVIGAFNGSGLGLYPQRPIRGFKRINVFCAQDESIWDRAEKAEYSYGWSENFGKKGKGKRLEYVRGRIVEGGPERVVLQSENAGGCYRATKVAHTRKGATWWILATRITNRCDHAIRFDFFTGDDPWIGLYKSSDGDVGWISQGLVRHEQALGAGEFVVGGLYDLGNEALGQEEGSFSGQANFFLLDPALPLPDLAAFANSFAHHAEDVDETRALDNKTLTALNLGWLDRTLAPGKGLTVALALGLARTGDTPGQLPEAPEIAAADWSVWRQYLKQDDEAPVERVDFAAERVELEIGADEVRVSGEYTLNNRGSSSATLGIRYPIVVSADLPAPARVTVDGKQLPVQSVDDHTAEARFPVAVPGRGLARFRVHYTQPLRGRQAAYKVTSALSWSKPITRAVLIVRHPASLGKVRLSYPADHVRRFGDQVEHIIVRQPFRPDRELRATW